MGFFGVETVNDGANVSKADVDVPKDIIRKGGDVGGISLSFSKVVQYPAKSLLKRAAFSLKFDIKEPLSNRGGMFVFFYC